MNVRVLVSVATVQAANAHDVTLRAGRAYGAEGLSVYGGASRELDLARQLARQGSDRLARHAAVRAERAAVAAQRSALVTREDERRRAEAIVNDVDKQLNDLEGLYSAVTPK